MKTQIQWMTMALLPLLGGAAMAQEAYDDSAEPRVSLATRAEVRQAAAVALRDGTLPRGEATYHAPVFHKVSKRTRAEVAAEAREALRLGLIAYGEGPQIEAAPSVRAPQRIAAR